MNTLKPLTLIISSIVYISISGCGVLMDENRKSMALGYTNTAIVKPISDGKLLETILGLIGAPVGILGGLATDMIPLSAMPAVVAAASVGTGVLIASQMSQQTTPDYLKEYSSLSDSNTTSESNTNVDSESSYITDSSYLEKHLELTPRYGGHKTDYNVNHCLMYLPDSREKKIRNICPFDIYVRDGCVGKTKGDYTKAKPDYPYKGVYSLPESGLYKINANDDTYDLYSNIFCEENYGHWVRTACRSGQTPHFTSALGYSSVCIVDN
ncbi:hypothetical protein GO003_024785 [Methylicorpusculum oleiharenae]|uniref:hypothetical protein n=1 Tax=Methylicorpusculum oleiharenae TaxID=1338687 RepID=UPI00135C4B8E|nr:hypothetical protein [Methylicorpusculum oleiharenae]MCD2453598.1 hypothetical protein [Methylicorpusculum oleiharenae]